MRGITTPVTKIRRQVFTEIARLAYEDGDYSRIEELPYTIIPGEKANYRDSVFKERAIVGERLRLAVGLPPVSYTHLDVYKRQHLGHERRRRGRTDAVPVAGILKGTRLFCSNMGRPFIQIG